MRRRPQSTRASGALAQMPNPEPDTMFDHAYREPHPLVDEEREWFAGYRASFEGEGH